jgi:hypothetical protein
MGEIAEMMLDGTLCEGCGCYLGGQAFDVALLCASCAQERRREGHALQRIGKCWQDIGPGQPKPAAPLAPRVRCPTCSKQVKATGLKDHLRVVHAAP